MLLVSPEPSLPSILCMNMDILVEENSDCVDDNRTFSQLAADNQHAPIGILLIALLARVHSILEAILPPPPVVATSTSRNSTASKAVDSTSRAPNLPSTALSATKDTFDRGTVISRTQFPSAPDLVEDSSKTFTPASTSPPSRASPSEEMCLQAKDLKQYGLKQKKLVEQRRLVEGGEGDQPPPKRGKDKEKDATKSSKLKTTTKKKKNKAGDVFSSMFGGL